MADLENKIKDVEELLAGEVRIKDILFSLEQEGWKKEDRRRIIEAAKERILSDPKKRFAYDSGDDISKTDMFAIKSPNKGEPLPPIRDINEANETFSFGDEAPTVKSERESHFSQDPQSFLEEKLQKPFEEKKRSKKQKRDVEPPKTLKTRVAQIQLAASSENKEEDSGDLSTDEGIKVILHGENKQTSPPIPALKMPNTKGDAKPWKVWKYAALGVGVSSLAALGIAYTVQNLSNKNEMFESPPIILPLEEQAPVSDVIPIIQETNLASIEKISVEKKIISYNDSTLVIEPIPGYGLAAYAAAIADNELEQVISLSFDQQKELLQQKKKTLAHATKEDLRNILSVMSDIARGNPQDIYHQDMTLAGLKDATKNIIYTGVPLEIKREIQESNVISHKEEAPVKTLVEVIQKYETEEKALIERNYTTEKLPSLKVLMNDYFTMKEIDTQVVETIVKNISYKFNEINDQGIAHGVELDPLIKKESRLAIAKALYTAAEERKERDMYMLPEEIILLVNEGTGTEAISLQDIIFEEEEAKELFVEEIPIKKENREKQREFIVTKRNAIQKIKSETKKKAETVPKQVDLTTAAPMEGDLGIDIPSAIPIKEEKLQKPLSLPGPLQKYINLWEMILESPGENILAAEEVLRPSILKFYDEYMYGNYKEVNLNPLPRSIRIAMIEDLLILGENNDIKDEKIYEIINIGFSKENPAYISEEDFRDALMQAQTYNIVVKEEKENLILKLEEILVDQKKDYKSLAEKADSVPLVDLYYTARKLKDLGAIAEYTPTENILEELVRNYKEGDKVFTNLTREQRVSLAAHISIAPHFADRRKVNYLDNKDIEAMVNTVGRAEEGYISLREIRSAAKEEFGKTRKAAKELAIEQRREETFYLYLIARTDNPELTPYQFSQIRETQEMLGVSSSTIRRDLNRYNSLKEEPKNKEQF